MEKAEERIPSVPCQVFLSSRSQSEEGGRVTMATVDGRGNETFS
jgi:hypothetical protein